MSKPLNISKFKTGLVRNQPNQVLVNDAFPVLQNAIAFRNTVRRKSAWDGLGRLRRVLALVDIGLSGASPWTFNIFDKLSIDLATEPNASIALGSFTVSLANAPATVFTDDGNGNIVNADEPLDSGTINYQTGDVSISYIESSGVTATLSVSYYPTLPAMGILDRNVSGNITNVYFDTKYAYKYISPSGFREFLPGTEWSWTTTDWILPYSFNYWQDKNNNPIFWVTDNSGTGGNVIRYTNGLVGSAWYDFSPTIDGTNFMYQALFLVPFRGRLFAFNTWEGATGLGNAINRSNLVRCSSVAKPFPGTPFTDVSPIISDVNPNAWNDTIVGQGYSEPLPTNEAIVSVRSVMNQLMIKTNTKTYLLSYTGMNSAPFKIDLVDDQLGTTSPFGWVSHGSFTQEIGNRSITQTAPTQVIAVDEKIPDFFFEVSQNNHGAQRIYGVRNFLARTNNYIYPYAGGDILIPTYPNQRLIFNYENKSWANYDDSFTCLGYFRDNVDKTWAEATNDTWATANFPWVYNSNNEPPCAAGNQQGFIGLIDQGQIEGSSLTVTGISIPSNGRSAVTFTSPNHNLTNASIISLSGFIGDYTSLNGVVGQCQSVSANTFILLSYDATEDDFIVPVALPAATPAYNGGGLIANRYNFNITTKAFNLLDEGTSLHISYLDTVLNWEEIGTAQVKVFASLDTSSPVNLKPNNTSPDTLASSVVSMQNPAIYPLTNVNNRTIINQRANFLSLEFSLSNAVMASNTFSIPFVLSGMTLWIRPAGKALVPFSRG